jgi:hypothetical protein
MDLKNLSGELKRLPTKDELEAGFDVATLVEFYSR